MRRHSTSWFAARGFLVLVSLHLDFWRPQRAAVVYVLALIRSQSVFEIAALAFSGYVTLTPTLFLGVRWRRFNTAGAVASLLAGSGVLLGCQAGWLPTFGFLPVLWGFGASLVVAVSVSLATEPAATARTERAFGRS